jgi:RNA polymerase sigma-70 factor, ECF subfamily
MDRATEFRRLYRAHRGAVHAYLVARTADRSRAADLMQDTFLRVWQRLPELVDISADGQRAWIFTVARSLSIDEHRRVSARATTDAALRHKPARASPPASTLVISAERVAVITEAINHLPEPQRTVLALTAAGGLTSAQIATALDVPAGTVRYRLLLARRALTAALDNYDHPSDAEHR